MIKVKNITLIDDVETKEAKKLLKQKKKKLFPLWFIPFIITLCLIIVIIPSLVNSIYISNHLDDATAILIFFLGASIITFINCIILYSKQIAPFYKLLKIAINNDRVRHEEKIRFKERERLIAEKQQKKQ